MTMTGTDLATAERVSLVDPLGECPAGGVVMISKITGPAPAPALARWTLPGR